MSSFYDDASLVVIPSGYKTSKVYTEKPTDGSGDLAFTRTGDTATRVNSAGLIEKVRTNLILQSNSFDTTWTNTNSTDTGGQAGYDGTSNAWILQSTIASGEAYLRQTFSASGLNTFSIYAKAGTSNFLAVYVNATSGTDPFAYFNLSTGAVGTTSATATASIVSIGSGWYRCLVAYNATISNIDVYVTSADGSFLSTTGNNILIQAAQLETGDVATDYIPTTTAAVSVGPVANVPRLDYLGSTCGKLLLEPQRTNLVTYSEQFDNAAWGKTTATVTANTTSAPDGTISADTFDATNNFAFVSQAPTLASGTATTYSVFVKNIDAPYVNLQVRTTATAGLARFDFTGSTLTSTTLTTGTSSSFADYGNGWYRCVLVCTTSEANQQFRVQVPSTGDSVFIWGAQVEAGAYPTSYIPTLAASATRGADACSKTGISSLIGQTEGTLFAEVDLDYLSTGIILAIGDGTANNRFVIQFTNATTLFCTIRIAGVNVDYSVTVPAIPANGGIFKIALGYKTNDYVFALNGVIYSPSTDTRAVPACSVLYVGQSTFSANQLEGGIKQALLFPTRLTNASLAELTTL